MLSSLRRFFSRHGRGTVASVVAAVLGSWIVHGMLVYRLSPTQVDKTLSAILAADVHSEAVGLSWTGMVTLRGLVISTSRGTLMSAPSARVQIVLRDLLRGQINAQAVSVNQPDVALNLDQWADWSRRLQGNPLSGKIPILLNDGRLRYGQGGGTLAFTHVDGRMILWGGNLTGDAGFVDDQGDRYHVTMALHTPYVAVQGTVLQPSLVATAAAFHVPPALGVRGAVSVPFWLKGQLPDLSLDAWVRLHGPAATLAPRIHGTLHATSPPSFEGLVDLQGGTIPGVGPVQSLAVPVTVSAAGLRISGAHLDIPAGRLHVDAVVPTVGTATVAITSDAFNPSRLSGLENTGLRASAGPLKLRARGTLSELSIRLAALYPTVQTTHKTVQKVHLDGQATLAPGSLHLTALTLTLDGRRMRVAGALHWLDPKQVVATISDVDVSMLAALFNAPSALEPLSGLLAATVTYQPATSRIEVHGTMKRGKLAGEAFTALDMSLDSVRNEIAHFTGRWRQQQQAGLLQVQRTAGGPFTFKLKGAVWQGQRVPEVEGQGTVAGEVTTVAARITGVSPPLDVAGRLDGAAGTFTATTTLNGQDIGAARRLLPAALPAVSGRVYGPLTVAGPGLSQHFEGDVKDFKSSDLSMATLHMSIQGAGGVTRATVSAPQVTWRGHTYGAVSCRIELKKGTLSIQNLALPLTQPPLSLSGTIDLASGRLRLQTVLSGMAVDKLLGAVAPEVSAAGGTLTGRVVVDGRTSRPTLRFDGRAADVAGLSGRVQLSIRQSPGGIAGTWRVSGGTLYRQGLPAMRGTLSGNATTMSVQGSFAAQSMPLVATRFPGLAGRVTFRAKMSPSARSAVAVDGTLTRATLAGRSFPSVRAVGSADRAGHAQLSTVSVASLGMTLWGAVDFEQQTLALSGTLRSTPLQELTRLAGSPGQGASGLLSGPLLVSGTLDAPRVQFQGRVARLTANGLALGAGRLNLTGTPTTVNGTLQLDRPVGMTSGSFLSRIPGLSAITNAAVSVTGATISGSPQNPRITPTVRALRGF